MWLKRVTPASASCSAWPSFSSPSEVQTLMFISDLICRTASQIVSRSRADGPRVAVTMQYFTAPIACACRAPSTSSSTVCIRYWSTPVS